MLKRIKSYLKITVTAFQRWYDKDPFRQSAVIAYYAIFSMPGLLVVVIAIASVFFEREMISGHVYNQIAEVMGSETAKQVQTMVSSVSVNEKTLLASIVGVLTILLGASGVFAQLQVTLNIIWEVKARPRQKILTLIRTRLFSYGLILSIGFLLLISLAITMVIALLSDWAKSRWPDFLLVIFYVLNFVVSFAVIMLLFAIIFKTLPDAKIKWRHVWLGSAVTALLFILGKSGIGYYLGKTDPGSQYGAAGSIVLILLWVSYSSMILFYGAEFTRAYADHFAGKVPASQTAVKVPGRQV